MARLIDANELIEVVKGSEELLDFQKDELIACVDACDTAYDVEGVVSELQYMKENFEKDCSYWKEHSWRDNTVYNEADLNDRQADCYSDAIEIVRKGGVE